MRTFLGIILCVCVVNLPLVKTDCTWTYTTVNIDDTTVNKEIFNYTADGEFEFTSWQVALTDYDLDYDTALTYFQHDQQGNTLYVSTTDTFKNLNTDAYTDGKDLLTITLRIKLTCDSKVAESTLLVQITNTNQNAPKFSESSFTYSLPMPIMPKTDFSLYGDEITATDIDFSTSQITFSIDPNHFAVTTSKIGNKTFRAVFSANQILRFTESQTYTLTATDSGSSPKSTPVTITLNVDPTAGFDSPSFSSAYYSYNYTGGDAPALTPTGGDIVIQSDKPDEATYALSGEYSNSFDMEFENTTNTFSISLKSETSLPEDESSQIILTLSFTTDVTVSAAILITIVKDESIPVFTNDYYVGTYDVDTHLISWNEPIEISDASAVVIAGEKASLFTIDSTTYELKPNDSLSSTDFDDNSNLFLTLIASSTNKAEARAPVVISLATPEELKFDSVSYYGSYKVEDEKGVVTLDNDIGFIDVTDFLGITIAVDSSYSDYFKVEIESLKWKVTVLQALSSTIINENSELAIPITASKTDGSTKAILLLTLPDKAEINFDNSYYTATYAYGEVLDTVDLDQDILIEGADGGDVIMTLEGYDENFLISYNSESSKYEITVKANLNSTILNEETQLIIKITASKTDKSASADTVLVLKLPETTIQFDKTHYEAEYILDTPTSATVKLPNNIILTGADPSKIEFTFEEYNENFEIKYNETSTYYDIIVSKLLDPINAKQLVILITATETDTKAATTTILVLTLPKTTPLSFNKTHYEAEYILDTPTSATVILTNNIILTGADPSKIEFTFEEYNENFEIKYNETSTYYDIIVSKLLDPINAKQLVILITATETDTKAATTTILVLTLPETTTPLSFNKTHYEAEYILDTPTSATVKLTNNIILTGADPSKIEFTFEEYNENFEIKYNETSTYYDIIVSKLLDPINAKQLVILITATETDTKAATTTILVLTLPETTTPLSFNKTHYEAEYILDTPTSATVKLTNNIILTGADPSKIEFTFEEYNENFEIKYNETSTYYDIIVSKLLDPINAKQLVILITATETDTKAATTTILVLTLPETTTPLSFNKTHYEAEYILDTPTSATVKLTNNIILTGADPSKIEFTFEEYNENFEIKYNETSTYYDIIVSKLLDPINAKQLVILITATETDTKAATTTILVLTLPETTTPLSFNKTHYEAEYILDTPTSATVKLTNNIILTGADPSKIEFTFEEYNENFEIKYNETSTYYDIIVSKLLDPINAKQLVILITATETDTKAATTTILVLTLPETTTPLSFNKTHYEAEYILDTPTSATVKLTNNIILTGADPAKMDFTFEEYNENFEIKYNETSTYYDIIVSKLLDPINAKQLVILITATETNTKAATTTILVLTLPETTTPLSFDKTHYEAEYILDTPTSATVILTNNIIVSRADPAKIEFIFEGYENTFSLKLDTSGYKVIVDQPLNNSIPSNTHLIITISASVIDDPGITASTIMVLKLPSDKNDVFESNHYMATYTESTSSEIDHMETSSVIKIKSLDFAKTALNFEGYDDNFAGSCDESTLQCTITVKKNLNASILSVNTELVLTLSAYNEDNTSSGITVLLVKLPFYNATFKFTNQHYSAVYTIEKENNGKATVALGEAILFDGADSTDLTLVADDYSDQFSFTFNTQWSLVVTKNLDQEILGAYTELIISLTASKTEKGDSCKATLVIKLPDKTTMAFNKLIYSGEYVISGDKQSVVLTDTSEIETTDTSVQIILDSYKDNFEAILGENSKWTINVKNPLEASVFTENTQLKLLMTITKVGVTYGEASLIIKLPNPSFNKGFYIAMYLDVADASISCEAIEVLNVEVADIQVNLSAYNDYIYTDLLNDKWAVKLSKPLPSDIILTTEILLITLEARRKSDNIQLASSTLLIKLPDVNLTDSPRFNQFAFYGEYKNSSDKSTVELNELIEFSNSDRVTVASVTIEEGSSQYSSYFTLNHRTDGAYDISVDQNLPEDLLSTESNVVLSLIASTTEGNNGHAALVINLPKTTREVSVQFEGEQILYNGTYENGTFKSPSITLETNSTDDNQISVVITTDLDIDNKYFKSTYTNKVLSLNVDNLPEDILKKYTVIPLKLAITDKDTGDTVYAVVNVNVNYNSGGDNGDDDNDVSDNDRTGLLVAVIILAILLVAVIIATILFWYFKIRNARYVKMEEEEVEKSTTKPHPFTKNLSRQVSTSVPSNSALRRPTGLPIGFEPPESPTEEASNEFEAPPVPTAPVPDNEKKVVFDDHVQSIDDFDIDQEKPSNFQSIGDRRPTQFVFAYPMEAVLDSPTDSDERRESSDYEGFDSEKKKSVLFDENVERMHIDIDDNEDNDGNDSGDDEDPDNIEAIKKDNLSKFKSELEVKLDELVPSEAVKEDSLDL